MIHEVLIDIKDYEFYLPKRIFHNILVGKLPYSRMNRVVEWFKKEGYKNRINIEQYRFDDMEPDIIYTFYHSRDYFYIKDYLGNLHIYRLYRINGVRPWTIQKSKYGETIHFMSKQDQYKIIDKETSYAESLAEQK